VQATTHAGVLGAAVLIGGPWSSGPSALDVEPRLLTVRPRRQPPPEQPTRRTLLAPADDHREARELRRRRLLTGVSLLCGAVVSTAAIGSALA
jgi:hypothetical protein